MPLNRRFKKRFCTCLETAAFSLGFAVLAGSFVPVFTFCNHASDWHAKVFTWYLAWNFFSESLSLLALFLFHLRGILAPVAWQALAPTFLNMMPDVLLQLFKNCQLKESVIVKFSIIEYAMQLVNRTSPFLDGMFGHKIIWRIPSYSSQSRASSVMTWSCAALFLAVGKNSPSQCTLLTCNVRKLFKLVHHCFFLAQILCCSEGLGCTLATSSGNPPEDDRPSPRAV